MFIIDHRGVLRQITMNDLPVGRSVDETLRLVQAFQYTDSHGEVCPAGWKPGADTVNIYKILITLYDTLFSVLLLPTNRLFQNQMKNESTLNGPMIKKIYEHSIAYVAVMDKRI